jgi:hypothetical protein
MNVYSRRVKFSVSIFLVTSMFFAMLPISVFPSFLGVQAPAVLAQPESGLKIQNTTTNNLDPGSVLRLFETNIAIDLP